MTRPWPLFAFAWPAPLVAFLFAAEAHAASPDDEVSVAPEDWPWWRGPGRNGVADATRMPPWEWGGSKNVVWKAPVPGRGHGSPTVVGGRVLLAAADEQRQTQSVLCYDRRNGELLWRTEVHRGGFVDKQNAKSSHASSTVASDGRRAFVNFLNDGAVYTTALTLDGEQVWQRKITGYAVHQGFGTSPAVYRSLVIVTADNKGGGAVVGLDRATGREVWRRRRPEMPNYASPIILTAAGRERLLLSGCERVTGLDPMTGETLWEVEGSTTETVTSVVTDGERIFISGGYPRNHVAALRADSGELVWEDKVRVYVPSLLVHGGRLYGVTDAGIATCWDCASGKSLWKERLGGTFTASPVLVGDHILATNEAGKTFVFKADPGGFTPVAENQLGDEVYATPAVCGGRIYMRVASREGGGRRETLYCLGEGG